MAVYKRRDSTAYSYDFQLAGARYSGSTGTADLAEAEAFERSVRNSLISMNRFCQAILRRARLQIGQTRQNKIGYVYMIRAGYFIKIGHSNDPNQRLKSINTANPEGCELLLCIRGSAALERQLHREFEACHYKKEWFFLCGKLKSFVNQLEITEQTDTEQSLPPSFPPMNTEEIVSV